MDPTFQGRTPQVPYRRPGGRFNLSRRALLMIGGGLAILIVGFLLLAASGDKSGALQQRLSARLATFSGIVAEGTNQIQSPDLREFNSRLSIQLLSDTASINTALATAGMKSISKDITADEADKASFDNLKTAALNSRFDDAYRTLVAQKLDSTMALMQELYNETRSKSLKASIDASYANLKQLENQLAASTSS